MIAELKQPELEPDTEIAARGEGAPTVPARPIGTDPMMMIATAIERGMDVDTMKEIIAMRRELKAEAAKEAFFNDLSLFQAAMPEIPKTKAVIETKGEHKGEVRYRYAPLDVIVSNVKPILERFGFSYTMKPVQEGESSLTAVIAVHHRDGHEEETSFTVPIDSGAFMSAPQKIGSARTFAMRYAFCNAFGILTSDDDDDGGAFSIDEVLAAAEQIAALDTASTAEELRETMRGIWKALPEEDRRRTVVRQYYDQRKAVLERGEQDG